MKPVKTIRVLIVDDSVLVREMIRDILESEADIVVVGEASNGEEAITGVISLKPDIVTMDIEMPVMGGLEAIERIMAEHPVPILVVTALTGVRTAFSAVSKGALDVIEKPDISPENVRGLIKKIRVLANVDVTSHLLGLKRQSEGMNATGAAPIKKGFDSPMVGIIAIAASTGGPQAIHNILSHLPAGFSLPIVITQHIAEGFTHGMVDWLKTATPLTVRVASNGDVLTAGNVYVNPAENSMRVTGHGMIILGDRDIHQIYNPSCNTLLDSVATAYRERAIGLIMSGMGDDGVTGMGAIRNAGGTTLAQDAGSSVIFGMNRIAVDKGFIQKVVPLGNIPAELMHLAGVK